MGTQQHELGVSLGELTRTVTELRNAVVTGFRDVNQRIDREVVQADVYKAEQTERDARLAVVQRSLGRFYGFLAAVGVAVIGASVTAIGAIIVALLVKPIH